MRFWPTLFAIAGLAACSEPAAEAPPATPSASDFATTATCAPPPRKRVRIEGGTFLMGEDAVYEEEGPPRETRIDGFWIDPHESTDGQFAAFVKATGYVTIAEKPVDPAVFGVPLEQIPPDMLLPGSAVFTPPAKPSKNYRDWWQYVPGVSWKKPYGPQGPDARADQPVVHLACDDMQAYAKWKSGRLPTEAEWEFAASVAGKDRAVEQPGDKAANSWQGVFPLVKPGTGSEVSRRSGAMPPMRRGFTTWWAMYGKLPRLTSVPAIIPPRATIPKGRARMMPMIR